MDKTSISYFDPQAEWLIVERGLPHWAQAGCVVFITWRLGDSLPSEILNALDQQIAEVLLQENLNPSGNWKLELAQRDTTTRGRVQWKLFATRDKFLDDGLGACHLANPQYANIALNSLLRFDDDRYYVTDTVVMPNHIHFLCSFQDAESMLKQCMEWKRFTGRGINKLIGRSGEFWQVDQFDHLIRSPEQFDHYRRYIAANPKKANLSAGSYLHFQKPLT